MFLGVTGACARAATVDGADGTRAVIRLFPAAEVSGPWVLLGQVADIKGEDVQFVERLQMVVVGQAPLPGQKRQLHVGQIRMRLRQSGIADTQVDVEAPAPSIPVTGAARRITADQILQELERAVQAAIGGMRSGGSGSGSAGTESPVPEKPGEGRLAVDFTEVPPDVLAPEGNVELRIGRLPSALEGPMVVGIGVWANGRLFTTVWVRATVIHKQKVVVATQDIPLGSVIKPEWLSVEERTRASSGPEPHTDPSMVVGQVALRPISAESTLSTSMVAMPSAVQKGRRVWLIVKAGGIQLATPGIAQQNGTVGEEILVKNLDTGRTVPARVVDSESVEAVLPVPPQP